MKHYDVIVIGGGLLGCFALRALTRYNIKAALFERREDFCTGISRANTAVVYSGYDTKPGTLRARLCVRAALDFDKLCRELGVRYARCGSLMASFGPRGDAVLAQKYEQGLANGVPRLRLLDGREALRLEPALSPGLTRALYVPDTGTVNPWELCIAAAENAAHNGAALHMRTEVSGISQTAGGYLVVAENSASHSRETFFTRGIVNCAGLSADQVHEMIAAPEVRIVPSVGDYLVLDTKAAGIVKHIIFHEPETGDKGVTLVPTVDGNVLIGATQYASAGREVFASSQQGLALLRKCATEVVPALPLQHIIRNFGAIRPNPFQVTRTASGQYAVSDKSIRDFCILNPADHPGLISLVGIKTPGLTCAHELGLHVAEQMADVFAFSKNENFDPRRTAPARVRELTDDVRAQLVNKHPTYGRIVCHCREVSEGEIVDAIRAAPDSATLYALKRRTGAGSGRCQGGFCTPQMMALIARETGQPLAEIQQDAPGSYLAEMRQEAPCACQVGMSQAAPCACQARK